MKKSVKVIAGLMIAVLSVSSVSVYAAEKAATRERPAVSKRTDVPKGNFGFPFSGRGNAEKPQRKELTEEEKAAKIEEAKKSLAEKLAAGKITQEQHDEMLAKIEAGDFGFRFNGRNNAEQRKGWNKKGGNRWTARNFVQSGEA